MTTSGNVLSDSNDYDALYIDSDYAKIFSTAFATKNFDSLKVNIKKKHKSKFILKINCFLRQKVSPLKM